MSGREVVEVRNPADTVGLVLSKRSDTMRRQARKRYLQVVERNGGPGRDRTDDLFHAMEARSQLRHRPTWCGGQLLSFNSRLASPPRQTRLAWSTSNRIWLAKHKGHNRSLMSNSRNILVQSLFCFIFIGGLSAVLAPAAAGAQDAPAVQPPVAYTS